MQSVLVLFGTRPEIIKLSPVVAAIARRGTLSARVVSSSQHVELLRPFVSQFGMRIDDDLQVMTAGQRPGDVASRVLAGLGPIIEREKPSMILVQGDTMTALAGAMAGAFARVPVGHVEAGLRTGDRASPFPEEINRRAIAQFATLHFAATAGNVRALKAEGVDEGGIHLVGNTVVDALLQIRRDLRPSEALRRLIDAVGTQRLVVLTTHRRENFGGVMAGHLQALRRFVERHADVEVVFPVHPNPAVRAAAKAELGDSPRIRLIEPLDYTDFIHLLSKAWLIASDSGGIQEEAPSLGKPVLILRDTTERPEVLDCGVGRLVGHSGREFEALLEAASASPAWHDAASAAQNPFGRGDAGERIVDIVERFLAPAGAATAASH